MTTVDRHAAPPGYRLGLAGVAALAVGITATALPTAGWWHPLLMLLVPAGAAWLVRRRSLLVCLYLAETAVFYGVTGVLSGAARSPELVALVSLWSVGLLLGTLITPTVPAPGRRRLSAPSWVQFALAVVLVAVQAVLVGGARLGFQAQVSSGTTTPTGLLGTLATAAPQVVLLVGICAVSSGSRLVPAGILGAVEILLLSATGFRGAGVAFVLAAAVAGALVLPADSPWRRARRLLVAVPVGLFFVVASFVLAAQVRSSSAGELGVSSSGTALFGLDQAVTVIGDRLDASPPLAQAIYYQHDASVRRAVDWTTQLQSVVPRVLWPDKPAVDYGKDVAAAVYGVVEGQSASYITVIGDTFVNFGRIGVLVGALALGGGLSLLEGQFRLGVGLATPVLAVVLATAVLDANSTLVFLVVGAVRSFLVTAVLWYLASLLDRRPVPVGPGAAASRSGTFR